LSDKLKINIGAGYKKYPGLLTVDMDPRCKPDYICDFEKDKLPFEDNSVELVLAEHILEHLGDGFFHLMQEVYRVCCDGAEFHVMVPHHRHDWFANDPTHKRPITIDGMKLFSKTYNEYCESIDDGSTKLGLWLGVDFEMFWYENDVDPYYHPYCNKMSQGTPEQREELERFFRMNNNIITEVRMKFKVHK
jgi:ubiquinone/menaquinone biosynthesis C-methylase UbiE